MTIAITLKVHDGLVLGSDSATTLIGPVGPNGEQAVVNVYNNANKVFNLCKGLPIGGMTWGAGSIGVASISTITKDLRKRFMDPTHAWHLDPGNYKMEDVAKRTREFFYDELYTPTYANSPIKPSMGFLVAGYSAGEGLPEEWLIEINNGACQPPKLIRQQGETGMSWYGEPEAITRMILGYSPALPRILGQMGIPQQQIAPAIDIIRQNLAVPFVQAPMPIQDAIDLAEFLIHTTIMYSRFAPGAKTVGGPAELAAITKHEGYKWIERKHYFDPRLNPEEKIQ